MQSESAYVNMIDIYAWLKRKFGIYLFFILKWLSSNFRRERLRPKFPLICPFSKEMKRNLLRQKPGYFWCVKTQRLCEQNLRGLHDHRPSKDYNIYSLSSISVPNPCATRSTRHKIKCTAKELDYVPKIWKLKYSIKLLHNCRLLV